MHGRRLVWYCVRARDSLIASVKLLTVHSMAPNSRSGTAMLMLVLMLLVSLVAADIGLQMRQVSRTSGPLSSLGKQGK